ncbi:MAG: hypothetical protein HC767_01435 [Akkermansiaceae bacterium]|nr:hypothetical protein [Akkermansiaceae bacterium]
MVQVFAGALKTLPKLQALYVMDFTVTDSGLMDLATTLAEHNTSLEELAVVGAGSVTKNSFQVLSDAISNMANLRNLTLGSKQVLNPDILEAVFANLSKLRNLEVLDVSGYHAMHTEYARVLINSVVRSDLPKLRKVVLRCVEPSAGEELRSHFEEGVGWLVTV